jgi:hypothetical protein
MTSKLDQHRMEITAAYEAGATAKSLAAEYGCTDSTVRRCLSEWGVEVRPPRRGSLPTTTADEEAAILAAYQRGESALSIAEDSDRSYPTIISVLKRNGIAQRRRLRRPTITVPTDPAVLAYLAGIIDADGSIVLRRGAERQALKVLVANTSPDLMDWLQETFGGRVHWADTRPDTGHRIVGTKPAGQWVVPRVVDSFRLLTAIEPYLVIKRSKAQAGLAWARAEWGL